MNEQAKEYSVASLRACVDELVRDWDANQETWTNQTAGDFVEALAGWLADMDGYYQHIGTTAAAEPPWRVIADALCAARFYE